MKTLWGLFFVTFSFHLLFLPFAWGLDYPTKPITLVASATAGGPSDLHARILGEAVSKELGVPMVVVNKAGPGGALGASYVANEKADGYTFLVTQAGTFTTNFALYPNLTYKRTDFVPLFRSIIVPCNVAVRADSPWKTLQDFLDSARKNPGKLRSGSSASNLSLLWEDLIRIAGVDVTEMKYKSAADDLLALMGGHIDVIAAGLTPMVPHIEAGKIRLLASITSERNKNYPEVPTLYELGYRNSSKDMWNGFFAPSGIPRAVMEKFIPPFQKALAQQNIKVQLEKVGVFAGFMGTDEFSRLIDNEYKFYMEVAKRKK